MRIHVSAQILHTADTEGKWTSFTQARKYTERQMMFFVFCFPPPGPLYLFLTDATGEFFAPLRMCLNLPVSQNE